jgi:CRISPR system Cascade subunit CasA
MPRDHVPERAVWRGLEGILVSRLASGSGRQAPDSLPPGTLAGLAGLRYDGLLDPGYPVRTRAVAMHYGSNNSVVDDMWTPPQTRATR